MFYSARGTGRTRAMVENLPEGGSIVVIHTEHIKRYMEKMIRDFRGPEVAKATKVVVIRDMSDVDRAICGRSLPVYFDHACFQVHMGETQHRALHYAQTVSSRLAAQDKRRP